MPSRAKPRMSRVDWIVENDFTGSGFDPRDVEET